MMEIQTIASFVSYYETTRATTLRIIQVTPPDQLDWSYKPGKFSIADIIRHLAAIERHVFAEMVLGNPAAYKGCGKELADGFDPVMAYFNTMHQESMQIFKSLSDDDLTKKIKALNGREVEIGHFLRALVMHEIHHRGALCIYLNLLNIVTPPILGLTEEQVKQLSMQQLV
jgi:uncharacterized damage-inducible protein DinB